MKDVRRKGLVELRHRRYWPLGCALCHEMMAAGRNENYVDSKKTVRNIYANILVIKQESWLCTIIYCNDDCEKMITKWEKSTRLV